MPVHLVISRLVKGGRIIGTGGMNIFAFHHPDAHPFHPAGIDIPGILDSHLCICRMQAARMFVIEALFAADKYFPQGPLIFCHTIEFNIVCQAGRCASCQAISKRTSGSWPEPKVPTVPEGTKGTNKTDCGKAGLASSPTKASHY